MKKTVILLAALLTTGASLSADTPAAAPAAPSSSWVFTPAFASQYMFRGARLGGPSFQPALEFDQGPLALGVWANTPISNKVDGQSDPEFDFYGTYSFEIAKDTTLVPGFTIYTYPDAEKNLGFYRATFEPNLALNYSISGWKFTPKVYYDFVLKGPTLELTAAYALPLPDIKSELDFTATAGTFKWTDAFENTTPKAKNWGDYYLVGVAMPFQVSTGSKLTIGFAYTKGSNNFVKIGTTPKYANSAAVGRGVVTVSYAITF
jgi:uncharacterized protein (TIGR02001 family)